MRSEPENSLASFESSNRQARLKLPSQESRLKPDTIERKDKQSQWPNMKTKKQHNLIYKRKKRKACQEEEGAIHEEAFSTAPQEPLESMFPTTTTATATTQQPPTRRWRKWRNNNYVLLYLAVVVGSVAQLICDTSNRWSVQGADLQEGPNKQRFVREPEGGFALLGQPTELACLIENKRGSVSWTRNGWILGREGINTFSSRYSIPEQNSSTTNSTPELVEKANLQRAENNNANNQTNLEEATTVISNCSLHIKNVSLADDDYFACSVAAFDGQHRAIKSKSVKLEVLEPPTRLTVVKLDEGPNSASSEDDAPFGSNQVTLVKQEQDEELNYNENHIERFSVLEDTRLRLSCRANQAKPRAELIWLDHLKNKVPKKEFNASSEFEEPMNEDSFVEELVSTDPSQSKLASSTLIWSLKVKRYHSNQLFTCLAKHLAFELEGTFPQLYGKQLKRQVRLEVLYKPVINLTKNVSPLVEDKPVKLSCDAHGRPNKLTYRWFIDTELVANATGNELQIERLTRQMHARSVSCEVSNEVGSNSASLRLDVRYAPAFVTHLLPASLQPDSFEPLSASSALLVAQQRSQNKFHHNSSLHRHANHSTNKWPSLHQLTLARQLALAYEDGHEVQLRCDFDSSPGLQQVIWYRVNTDYSIWANVTPSESDQFIASGALNAPLKRRHAQEQQVGPEFGLAEEIEAGSEEININTNNSNRSDQHQNIKRHIETHDESEQTSGEYSASGEVLSVDFEQMSANLMEELASFEMSQLIKQQQPQLHSQAIFEQVSPGNLKPTQTDVNIQEPLGWTMLKPSLKPASSALSGQTTTESHAELEPASLSLTKPAGMSELATGGSSNAQIKFKERKAHVSSSFITLAAARRSHDVIGKYICKAKPADGFPASARALYLVRRERPRIISHKEQWTMSSKSRAQVECLAQINTITDSSITWSKDGKLIADSSHGETSNKNSNKYWQYLQVSPDLLFMRSTLVIEEVESADFGDYVCKVSNSINSDAMHIRLGQFAATGFVFAVLASLSIGTVMLLVCIFALLLIYTPRRKLDSKVSINSVKSQDQQEGQRRGSQSSQKSTFDSKQALGLVGSQKGVANQQQQEHCDKSSFLETQAGSVVHQGLMNVAQQHHQRGSLDLANYSAEQTSDSGDSNRMLHSSHNSKLRTSSCSLGTTTTNLAGQQQQQRSANFAPIHEILEHKLQQGLNKAPRYKLSSQASAPPDGQLETQSNPKSEQPIKSETVTELEQGSSLINRLWSRLLMKPLDRSASLSVGRRVKSRPIISNPVCGPNFENSHNRERHLKKSSNSESGARRRSSLSTSLSILGSSANSELNVNKHTLKGNNNNLINGSTNTPTVNSSNVKHGINVGHLASSSANLIQDSTTGSDGSGSSGRSSSNQPHENNLHSNGLNEPDYMQQVMWNQLPPPPAPLGHNMNPSHKLIYAPDQLDMGANIYLNDNNATASYHPFENHLYSNGHSNYHTTSEHAHFEHAPATINGYTNQALAYNDHQNQSNPPLGSHFQQANRVEQSFYPSSIQALPARPCYATICLPSQQQQQQQQQFKTNDNNNYFPIQLRSATSQQCQFVPTSDAGDAYIDANYDTLIRNSAANKTPGHYMPISPTNNFANYSGQLVNGCARPASLASSSPNSLTTHTNLSSSQQDPSSQLKHHQIKQSQQELSNGNSCSNQLYTINNDNHNQDAANNHNQVTLVQADSTTTSITTAEANNLDNGPATHV